jgi:hypothetical protein
MIFVYDVFDCVLRKLVIQLTLLLLFPIVGHSIDLPVEGHSIALLSLNHSIDLSSRDHLIVSHLWSYSFASAPMTVTTRSMSKRLISLDTTGPSSTSQVATVSAVQSNLVLSSSTLDRGPSSFVPFQNFEISKFQMALTLSEHLSTNQSHNFEDLNFIDMSPIARILILFE